MAVKKKTGGNAAYDTFRGDLAAGTLGTVYIFYGEESYLREFYLSELRKKLVPAVVVELLKLRRHQGLPQHPQVVLP